MRADRYNIPITVLCLQIFASNGELSVKKFVCGQMAEYDLEDL